MKNKIIQFSNRYLQIFFIFLLIIIVCIYIKFIRPLTWYIYEKNAYSNETFQKIKNICKTIRNDEMEIDFPTKRLIYKFPETHPIFNIVYNENFIHKIRKICGNHKLVPCLELPIEYRKYQIGSEFQWHRDTFIVNDQHECVITLTNSSDSLTIMDNMLWHKQIASEQNSLMVVRSRGIRHKVTKCKKGERTILKVAFCTSN